MMEAGDAKLTQCCGPEGCGHYNDVPYPARYCVASMCMGWRWDDKQYAQDMDVYEDRVASGLTVAGIEPELTGYCGLAGVPQ